MVCALPGYLLEILQLCETKKTLAKDRFWLVPGTQYLYAAGYLNKTDTGFVLSEKGKEVLAS